MDLITLVQSFPPQRGTEQALGLTAKVPWTEEQSPHCHKKVFSLLWGNKAIDSLAQMVLGHVYARPHRATTFRVV